jgi:hypothetical protein
LRVTVSHKLVKIWSWGTFEIAELFKQLQAIQKCNENDIFLISCHKGIVKGCAWQIDQVAST